jgi:hypothetical protein
MNERPCTGDYQGELVIGDLERRLFLVVHQYEAWSRLLLAVIELRTGSVYGYYKVIVVEWLCPLSRIFWIP